MLLASNPFHLPNRRPRSTRHRWATKTIPLRAKADADVREVFWFAGKQFIGKAAPNQVLEWSATAGDYEVTALDDRGRAGSHSVVVR